ncbi:MAG: cysteine desulfurase family protein [Pyrinomonadaceae bacterium]
MFRRVYLDNSATTPVAPEVVEAMLPYLTEKFGNASSIHFFGQEARAAIDRARHQVAGLVNARPNEIIFTSGGTEADNFAILGLAESRTSPGHIITSSIEHSAVKASCAELEKRGFAITYLPVYEDGIVRIEDVEAAVTDETFLITIMMANNEIGTIQPITEIGRLVKHAREKGRKIYLHTDAVQAVGKMNVDVEEIGCDLLSMSAHKIYAPKGVGALYVRRGVRLKAQSLGGGQERGSRGGTESVPNIVAFGTAAEMVKNELEHSTATLSGLRNILESRIGETIPDVVFNGSRENRIPTVANVSFRGVEGEGLLINLDMQGIAVSTGSACSSGTLEPSPVIRALGTRTPSSPPDEDRARGAIRFSLGRFNTAEDIDRVLEVLPTAVETLRRLAPTRREQTA